jgi:hypothetical protein
VQLSDLPRNSTLAVEQGALVASADGPPYYTFEVSLAIRV